MEHTFQTTASHSRPGVRVPSCIPCCTRCGWIADFLLPWSVTTMLTWNQPTISLPSHLLLPSVIPYWLPWVVNWSHRQWKARADNMQQTAMSTAVPRCRITNRNENTCKHMRTCRSCSFCFRMHAGLSRNTLTCTELCLLECSSSSPSP